jgi:hypothetical protein
MKARGIFKISALTLLTSVAMGANAGVSMTTDQGVFAINGDVEFDNNINQKEKTGMEDKTVFDQSGRLLVGVSGLRQLSDSHYISTHGEILLKIEGGIDADDAWIAMGKENDWEVKLGRFEAYDMYPVGQDTYLEFADTVFAADGVDVYRTKEARGRSDNGQINLSKTVGANYFELSTNFMPEQDGTDTIASSGDNTTDTNAIFLRPVASFGLGESFRLAVAAEINATGDADEAVRDFTGYGATFNYSADMLSINVNYAYRDFDTLDRDDMSAAINAQYDNLFAGYIYAKNDIAGDKHESDTYYASYKFANIMDVEDLALYLGAYSSKVQDTDTQDSGARLRVKYLF